MGQSTSMIPRQKSKSRLTNRKWLESITFPETYVCSRNISLEVFVRYWISRSAVFYRGDISQTAYRLRSFYLACQPIWTMRFREVRLRHVISCLREQKENERYYSFCLHRKLDRFAYEIGLIPKLQWEGIRLKDVCVIQRWKPQPTLTEAEITKLLKHRGERGADLLLTILYTGLKGEELLNLRPADIQDHTLYIRGRPRYLANRNIPIHPKIEDAAVRTLAWMAALRLQGKTPTARIGLIQKAARASGLELLGKPLSLSICRNTFTERLVRNHTPMVAIYYLKGIGLPAAERTYQHFCNDTLKNIISELP